jgi:hypothetical protein
MSPRRSFWPHAALVMALAAAGCGGRDTRPAVWSVIAPTVIEPSCATASCHSAVAQRAGVVLEKKEPARHTLLDRFFVIPRDPDASEVMHLLRAEGSRRMPPDFALPETDIELIEQWITNGANDD